MYSEEKAKLVRGEAEKAEMADSEGKAALDSLGLPGSLSKWKELGQEPDTEGGVPPEVEKWVDEVQRGDGIKAIDRLFAELDGVKRKVDSELEAIGRELESESRECETMRVSLTEGSSRIATYWSSPRSNMIIFGNRNPLPASLGLCARISSHTETRSQPHPSQITKLSSFGKPFIQILSSSSPGPTLCKAISSPKQLGSKLRISWTLVTTFPALGIKLRSRTSGKMSTRLRNVLAESIKSSGSEQRC